MNESALWQLLKRHPVALGLSVVVHLTLLAVLIVGLNRNPAPAAPQAEPKKTIEAVVVDAAAVKAEAEKIKRAEQQKKQEEEARKKKLQDEMDQARKAREQEEQRIADLKRKQKEEAEAEKLRQQKLEVERKQKQQELEKLEKQKQAEQKRLAEIEEKRKAEEAAEKKRREAEEAEARRKAEEAELQRKMAEEEQRRAANAARLKPLRDQYLMQIQRHISQRWLQPASMDPKWQCEVLVQQNALGEILSVKVLNCTGSDAFRNSVEQAVSKSSPLPLPRDPDVFDKNLRFIFKPKT